jgi:hypothetical protein
MTSTSKIGFHAAFEQIEENKYRTSSANAVIGAYYHDALRLNLNAIIHLTSAPREPNPKPNEGLPSRSDISHFLNFRTYRALSDSPDLLGMRCGIESGTVPA